MRIQFELVSFVFPVQIPTPSSVASCGQRHSAGDRCQWLSLYVSLLYRMIGPPSMKCGKSFGQQYSPQSISLESSPIIFQYHRVGRRRCRGRASYDVIVLNTWGCRASATYMTKHLQYLEYNKGGCCTGTNLSTIPIYVSSRRNDVYCGGWRPNTIQGPATET